MLITCAFRDRHNAIGSIRNSALRDPLAERSRHSRRAEVAAAFPWPLQGPSATSTHLADNSVQGPEVEIDGTPANFSTVIGPFFDRLTEVEANKDARIRILGCRLGEAGI
jgi:hypothetical protein